MPVVSVVVPIYQQKDFVAEALSSLLSQTIDDIEIIAVDDGSTDGSLSIIKSFDDPRLILISRDNGGPSVAINDGLLRARGDFIALLGGDDIAEPWRLAHQLEAMARRDIDVIFSEPTLIDREGDILRDAVVPNFYGHSGHLDAPAVFRKLILDGNFFCAPTAMFRRSVLEDVGLFRPELIQLQDYDYWMRAAAAGKNISVMLRRTTRYRRHAKNLSSSSANEEMMAEMMLCIYLALANAPSSMIAQAFPEMMKPGQHGATGLDRALIAMAHQYAPTLSNVFLLHAFISRNDMKSESNATLLQHLGGLPLPVLPPTRIILRSDVNAESVKDAEQAMWVNPSRKSE